MPQHRMIIRSILIVILTVLLLISAPDRQVRAVPTAEYFLYVDTWADDPAASACTSLTNEDCSLRGAISYANATPFGSVIHITIPPGAYYFSYYIPNEDLNATGDLDIIAREVHLHGTNNETTLIDGQTEDRVFDNHGGTLTMEHLKISQGRAPAGNSGGGAILNRPGSSLALNNVIIDNNSVLGTSQYVDIGGGIANYGTLTIQTTTITNNTACNGGGIASSGARMTIQNSYIGQNTARSDTNCGDGGGLTTLNGGSLMNISNTIVEENQAVRGGGMFNNVDGAIITDSTLRYNEVSTNGGGFYNYGETTFNRVTFSNNTAPGSGGGIANQDSLTLINTTVTANSAAAAGGLILYGNSTLSMDHCTVAGNTVTSSISELWAQSDTIAAIHNSILAGSSYGNTCYIIGANLTDQGYNLSSDQSCGFSTVSHDLIDTNPLLSPLADNGGPTETMALSSGDPAIDMADPILSLSKDQRGYFRPVNGNADPESISDIGAFEYSSFSLNIFSWLPMILKAP
jgi:CSLREA domain-containing protein